MSDKTVIETKESLFKLRKEAFKSQVRSELQSIKSSRPSRHSQVVWNEAEYDTFVKTVRRHGKDSRKVQEALIGKTPRQIKKFRKALSKQIDVTQDHPESDILATLLAFSDEEDVVDKKNIVAMEKRRKKLARKKRKMAVIDLGEPYSVPRPPQRQAPATKIKNLE